MYSSSYHSQFHLAAIGRWPARPRRLITGLTTAALLLFAPPQSRAHEGHCCEHLCLGNCSPRVMFLTSGM